MNDISVPLNGKNIPTEVRAKILSRIYEIILSWEPAAADDLSGDAAKSSEDAATDVTAAAD